MLLGCTFEFYLWYLFWQNVFLVCFSIGLILLLCFGFATNIFIRFHVVWSCCSLQQWIVHCRIEIAENGTISTVYDSLSISCYSLFQIKTDEYAHMLLKHHFINTISLLHVSALKGLSSGSTTDTFQQEFQQNELPDLQYQWGKLILLTLLLKCVCSTTWGWPFEGWNI